MKPQTQTPCPVPALQRDTASAQKEDCYISFSTWRDFSHLIPMRDRRDPVSRLEQFILRHIRLEGARVLRFLMKHPDIPFSAQAVLQHLQGCFPIEGNDLESEPNPVPGSIQESSIPITDIRSLKQIKLRLRHLQQEQEIALTQGFDIHSLKNEINFLRKYLSDTQSPEGRLKSFPNASIRAAKSMQLNLRRFHKRALALDPALAALIRSQLVTSPAFMWKTPEQNAAVPPDA